MKTVKVKADKEGRTPPEGLTVKVKVPKYKLISYTVKATIPTGMYANICPEITVEAVSLEVAERAVMPHIEALFAKYREGDRKEVKATNIHPNIVVTSPVTSTAQITPPNFNPTASTSNIAPQATNFTPPTPADASIVMTVPFTRAKTAIESCTSIEALAMIEDQVGKSVKLIDSEKQILATEILKKRKTFNG